MGRLPVSVSKIPGGGNLRRVKPINRNLVTTATASLRGAVFRASAKNGTFSLGEEAFDFFLLFTRETNPSSLPIQRSQREGEVFPITNVIVIIPQPMRPRFPFSLLLFLPSKEELTPLSLSLLVPARFPQSRLHISGEGGRE